MGKFNHSKLHEYFSNWHWRKCKRDAFLCDIDRIWVEIRDSAPKAVFDLKWGQDTLSPIGKLLGDWFELQSIPFYVVEIKDSFQGFTVYRPKTDTLVTFSEMQMVEWINKDLPKLEASQ